MSAPDASGFRVQGWCPGALRPMQSGNGLVVRIRPFAGQLSRAQAQGTARAARAHGNGLIQLSGRGNLQLRGVSAASHPALIADLRRLGLIDADITAETGRNILVTPFADTQTLALASELAAALRHAPELPGKFGFVLDCGPAPVLADASGDIRLERDAAGGLMLRCDGAALGAPVLPRAAVAAAIAAARWFLDMGGVQDGRGRMAALIARGHLPMGALVSRPRPAPLPAPGLHPQGALVGCEFGQMQAETLAALAALGDLCLTPWRMLLIQGLRALPDLPGLILHASDPRLRVSACTGAPGCLQAHRPVQALARRLAAQVPAGRVLHVSGCAKGCAHPGPADVTLCATAQGFDLIRNGRAQDIPWHRGLDDAEIDLKDLI